jgi:Lung seven transmembrane receptor
MIFFLTTVVLSQKFNRYDISQCIGVWNQDTIGGKLSWLEISVEPIAKAGKLAAAVFNFKDRYNIQAEELIHDYKLCSATDVSSGVCNAAELEKFHIKSSVSDIPVLNELISWSGDERVHSNNVSTSIGVFKFKYQVKETGFYCIFLGSQQSEENVDYKPTFTVSNPYGKLPAIFFPALAFFGVLSIIYTIIGILWVGVCFRHWKDLLTIQHYVSWVIAFLVVEMAFNYGFYENYNATGVRSNALLTIVVTLNSARNSLAFLMILLVCLGHGVVKPSLGSSVMQGCLTLAGAHFVFGTLYGTATLVSGDVNSNWVFLLTIPLSITLTVFYSWVMKGLEDTIAHLTTRRQSVKLLMYQSKLFL